MRAGPAVVSVELGNVHVLGSVIVIVVVVVVPEVGLGLPVGASNLVGQDLVVVFVDAVVVKLVVVELLVVAELVVVVVLGGELVVVVVIVISIVVVVVDIGLMLEQGLVVGHLTRAAGRRKNSGPESAGKRKITNFGILTVVCAMSLRNLSVNVIILPPKLLLLFSILRSHYL